MAKKPADQTSTHQLHRLQERYITHQWCGVPGTPVRIAALSLGDNKRGRAATALDLMVAGYLEDANVVTEYHDHYTVTAKAYDELEAEQPDLVARWNEHWHKQPARSLPGVEVRHLDLSLQKWILQHRSWYALRAGNVRRYLAGQTTSCELVELLPPDHYAAAADDGRLPGSEADHALLVEDAALAAHRRAHLFAWQLEEMMSRNLAWGLADLRVLSRQDAAHVQSGAVHSILGLLGHGPNLCFGVDPQRWPDELAALARQADLDLWHAQLRRRLVAALGAGLRQQEGWGPFLSAYRERLAESLRTQGVPETFTLVDGPAGQDPADTTAPASQTP